MERDILRHINCAGYELLTWDTHRIEGRKFVIGYQFTGLDGEVLFTGEDFGCSPCHCIDSDATLRDLLGWMTLKPGDTDRDYFKDYTLSQLAFAHGDAERISMFTLDEDPEQWENLDDWEDEDPTTGED